MLERIPYVALAVAILLVYVPRLIARAEIIKLQGSFDNHDPRRALTTLEGYGRRALGAHNNSLEAFPMFGISMFAAMSRGVKIDYVAYLAIAWVVIRSAYTWAYLADKATLRTLLFNLGMAVVSAYLILAMKGP